MPTHLSYPRLSTLIPIDKLPKELKFIKDELAKANNALFGSIEYTNLQITSSDNGATTSVYIEIMMSDLSVSLADFKHLFLVACRHATKPTTPLIDA